MRAICRARCSIPMAARWSAANGSRNNQICYRLAPQQWEGRSVLRIVGSIVAGALTAFVLVWGIELIGHLIFPLPEDLDLRNPEVRSEEHTSELQSLMRISYAVFCLKKKKT